MRILGSEADGARLELGRWVGGRRTIALANVFDVRCASEAVDGATLGTRGSGGVVLSSEKLGSLLLALVLV